MVHAEKWSSCRASRDGGQVVAFAIVFLAAYWAYWAWWDGGGFYLASKYR